MKIILFIASLLALIYSLWAGASGLDEAMAISAAIGLALLCFAHLDQIAKFKASAQGIEAETREVVNQARVTLAQLQELATITGKIQISLLVRQGRLGGYSEAEQEQYRTEILRILEKVGVSEEKRKDALSEVRRFTKFDYVGRILGGSRLPEGIPPEKIPEWKALRRRIESPPSPEELRAFMVSIRQHDPDREELLKDYAHYLSTHTHRRPNALYEDEN
jgi:hypothetical protein